MLVFSRRLGCLSPLAAPAGILTAFEIFGFVAGAFEVFQFVASAFEV